MGFFLLAFVLTHNKFAKHESLATLIVPSRETSWGTQASLEEMRKINLTLYAKAESVKHVERPRHYRSDR